VRGVLEEMEERKLRLEEGFVNVVKVGEVGMVVVVVVEVVAGVLWYVCPAGLRS
jgi:hypothetical protein